MKFFFKTKSYFNIKIGIICLMALLSACRPDASKTATSQQPSVEIVPSNDLSSVEDFIDKDLDAMETADINPIRRLRVLLGDTYDRVLSPIKATGAPLTLDDDGNTLYMQGEVVHEGMPYTAIVVFDVYNNNIAAAIYESDTKTLLNFEETFTNLPSVYRLWLANYETAQ